MVPDISWNGYVRQHFQFKKTWLVHRLVATVFIPNPLNLPVVNHKDGNTRNNTVENLEWVTHSDNMRHSWHKLNTYKNRVAVCPRGEANYNAKLTEAKVREIRKLYAAGGITHQKIATRYGVSKPLIRNIVARKSWAHVV